MKIAEDIPSQLFRRGVGWLVASSYALSILIRLFKTPSSFFQPSDVLPCRDIAAAVFDRKPPPPNLSTMTQPLEASNFLFDLDRRTQDVVKEVFQAQQGACQGDALHISGSAENFIIKNRMLQLPELRKWRQQFLIYSKMHPPDNVEKIPTLFVQYLNNAVR